MKAILAKSLPTITEPVAGTAIDVDGRGPIIRYMVRSRDNILQRFLDPVARALNPSAAKALLELKIDPVVQRRVNRLARKANEGELTEDERSEYELYIMANDLVSIMQLRARLRVGKEKA